MKYTHIYSDAKLKKLTPLKIYEDKPNDFYWLCRNIYSPTIVRVDRLRSALSCTVFHSGTYTKASDERIEPTIEEYLKSEKPTYRNNTAYLVANNAYDENDRKVLIDFYSNRWPETSSSVLDLIAVKEAYNYCGVRSDLAYPVVYHNTRAEVDVDAFVLMERFSKLSYMKGVSPTNLATDFMIQFIIESSKLEVKTPEAQLLLIERRPHNTVFPEYANTEAVSDLFMEYAYGNDGVGLDWVDDPSLDDILRKFGLEAVEDDLSFDQKDAIPDVDFIRATSMMMFLYVEETSDFVFNKKKERIDKYLTKTEVLPTEYSVLQIDKEGLKEIKHVSMQRV